MKRSVKIDIISPDDKRWQIINSIKLYRAVCRKAYAACAMAEMADADIQYTDGDIIIKPKNGKDNGVVKILEAAFGVSGKAHLYQLRKWIREFNPTWMSIMPESIHRDIVSPRWRAKDPEFPKATRGYLTLNGVRAMASFMRVGIYFKNTAPKMSDENRCITLKWDYDIGAVDFRIPKLDGSRYMIWKNLCTGAPGWMPGGMYLSEKGGKLFLIVSYQCPDKEESVDAKKVLTVTVNTETPETYITASSENKRFTSEKISIADATSWLSQIDIVRQKYERQLAATCRHKKSKKAIYRKTDNLSTRRGNGQKSFNHLWTRRIVQHAIRTKCGLVVLQNLPEREIDGHPWGWYQFKEMLKYKITEVGGKLQVV